MNRMIVRMVLAGGITVVCSSGAWAANRVAVGSTAAGIGSTGARVDILVETDISISELTIPLVARSISAGAFWLPPLSPASPTGRLATSMTGLRVFDSHLADFSPPDQFMLHYSAMAPSDCLPPGPLEIVTGVLFSVGTLNGDFAIDTMSFPPTTSLRMLDCNGADLTIDEFTPGTVTILPGGCPLSTDWSSSSLSVWSGAVLTNSLTAIDPEGDPQQFNLVDGPGTLNTTTGQWVWSSSPADTGSILVTGEAYDLAGPGNCPTASFTVTLIPLVPGDITCDGVVNVLDVVAEVDHAFRSAPPPVPCWEL